MTNENSEDANYDLIMRVLETPVKSVMGLGRLTSAKKIQKHRLTPSNAFAQVQIGPESPQRGSAVGRHFGRTGASSRGRYRNYPEDVKRRAIELFKETGDLKFVSQTLKVPSKNIDRWVKNGVARKKGGELISRKKTELSRARKVVCWLHRRLSSV